jgi:RHS repeat-associated protein
VGDYATSYGAATLIEQYNGSAWNLVASPDAPSGFNSLNAVTCVNASDCWAVGEYVNTAGWDDSLIEQYNGSVWSVIPSPNAGQYYNVLYGVACSSASICWAAGWEEGSAPQTLIEEDSGGSWSVVSSPDPGEVNWLFGLTCLNANDCWAVGQTQTPPSHIDTELIVQWNGSSWTSVNGANSPGGPQLNGVTCVSTTDCWAVGQFTNSAMDQVPLVEQYNGTSWSVVTNPNSVGADLNSVTCLNASACWAVGNVNQTQTYIEQYNGSNWAVVSSPSPDMTNSLEGVACLTTTNCWTVGYGGDASNQDNVTLVEQYNGTSWSVVASPNQTGAPVGGAVMATETYGGTNCSCQNADLGQGYQVDPVDTGFGNLSETNTDLSVPGRGIALDFSRTYNSLAAQSATSSGALGYGWTFNGLMSLSQPGGSGPVIITQEGGAQVVFNPTGSTYAPAEPRVIATLTLSGGVWTFVRDAQSTYTFSAAGQITTATDLNGYTTTYGYNGSSQLTSITDSEGRKLAIGWTGGHITTVTDANVTPNRVATYQYNDGNGNLTDVIDVNAGHTHFVYNSLHELINMFDPNCYAAGSACNGGNGVVNTYYSTGQVKTQQDQLGRTTTFTYTGNPTTAAGGTTTILNPKGNSTLDTYQFGLMTAETQGYGTASAATWQYSYDPFTSTLSAKTDANGHTTLYGHDNNGNQTYSVDPLGRITGATYNAFNEPLTKTDGNGITTTYTYSAHGDVASVSTPLVPSSPQQYQVTKYFYADSTHPGDVTSMQDPNGNTWTYTYDAYGDQMTLKDLLGDVSTTCYNAIGWKTASYPPRAGAITCATPPQTSPYYTIYSYVQTNSQTDEFGDVQMVTDPLGHTTKYAYDADRNLVSETDGDSNTTTYVYDLANEQTQIKRADSPQTTLITNYNSDGTVNYQEDGKNNKTLTYGYDSVGRLTSEEDADNNTTSYTLDGDGNVMTTQLPGGSCPSSACISNTYDADNELKTVTYSDGLTPDITNITYDSDARRLTMTDGTGTTGDVWDSLGRPTSEQNGAGATVGYGYDLMGHLTGITYPDSLLVTYGYDTADRLITVKDSLGHTTTYAPNADSFDTSVAYQNGVTASQTPDDADRLMAVTDKHNATTLASMTYTRDGNNQLTGETDSGLPQVAQPFTYTPLNQVKAAGSSSYGYDQADNLTTLTNGTNQLFDPADELCWSASTSGSSCSSPPSGATTFTYDSRGDRIKSTTGSASSIYGYDEASRLASFTSPTQSATYTYDGDGVRMSKTVNSIVTRFTWDSAGSTPLLLNDGTTDYVYGANGTPIEQVTARPAITLIGESSATAATGAASLTVSLPSGAQAGDQIFVDSTQSSTTVVTPPSTYTLVKSVASGGTSPKAGTSVFRHTVVPGDTSVTLTYTGTTSVKAVVLADYRGIDPSLPVDVVGSGSTAGGTTVVAPSVSAAYANDQLLIFQGARGTFAASTWTAPSGTTERVQVNSQANVSAGLADQALTAPGATGTRTSSFGASTNLTTVILAISQPPTVLFYQSDQLGSNRMLTDSAGVVRGTFSYDAYGNLIGSSGSYSTPLGWAGQYRDAETGLTYLRARYYDPVTAQFMSRDPALSSTRSPYAYVANNPLNASDASGRSVDDSDGGGPYGDVDTSGYGDVGSGGPISEDTMWNAISDYLGPNQVNVTGSSDDMMIIRSVDNPSLQVRYDLRENELHFEEIGPGGKGMEENGHVSVKPNEGPGKGSDDCLEGFTTLMGCGGSSDENPFGESEGGEGEGDVEIPVFDFSYLIVDNAVPAMCTGVDFG